MVHARDHAAAEMVMGLILATGLTNLALVVYSDVILRLGELPLPDLIVWFTLTGGLYTAATVILGLIIGAILRVATVHRRKHKRGEA